jgi:hypothetical protein
MAGKSGQAGAPKAAGGKCKWRWSKAAHAWKKVPGQDHCHGGAKCPKPDPPAHGMPEPADGTILIRLCR